MKEDNMEFLLDDEKLKKAYKKSKILSTIRIIVIVIIVVIPLYVVFTKVNVMVTYKMGTNYYAEVEKMLEITKPNTYISKANDTISFLSASGQYTVSKRIGNWKSVELYDRNSKYGLVDIKGPNRILSSNSGGQKAGEWPVNFDSSGNLTMMAFHPDIKYKEYKNDIALLNKVSSDSLLEMTLSFDKKYKINELSGILPKVQISELLIDGYTDGEMEIYKKEASENDGKATFIQEFNFIGFKGARWFDYEANEVSKNYEEFLNNLKYDFKDIYYKNKFRGIYSTLKSKEQLAANKIDVIGVVVYGNPEELQKLKSNPHIKASSVGIITKDIVFR
ncbi:anti sigma factor C-terminal domain-containing protein [Clostridium sp. FP1]|uniref:anti sigma factor C-terminal domain-containing protein n=1 Tax=Clostridium sp. FP1 TaxID=2724076 RepID=UPI0013E9554D|nr:anti sigma factor C-terminal domain-containing protein [Clostridium sp. FP1]MBZ9637498.1 anti-sigma factor C-terminal domain-containing protein [Clostridium sp. FP1]